MKKLIGFLTILLGATGCSVLFVDGAPQSAPSREAAYNSPCTDSRILPLVDLGMAGAFTASSFKNQFADDVVVADDMTDPDDVVITDDLVDADPEAEAGFSLEDGQWQIANIGLAAIAAGAGVWGWMKVSDCNAWLSQAIGEQSRQLADDYQARQLANTITPLLPEPAVEAFQPPVIRIAYPYGWVRAFTKSIVLPDNNPPVMVVYRCDSGIIVVRPTDPTRMVPTPLYGIFEDEELEVLKRICRELSE